MNDTFKIQLGAFYAQYKLYKTLAPVEADGFGTMHLTGPTKPTADDPRWVLVRAEHEDWQITRYHSGMWAPELEPLDGSLVRWIQETLYERLTKEVR
jgi:hypothetical protein